MVAQRALGLGVRLAGVGALGLGAVRGDAVELGLQSLDRVVALKFLPSSLSSSGPDKDRFVREAKSTSALNHPNILTVHDIDEADGELFLEAIHMAGQSGHGIFL